MPRKSSNEEKKETSSKTPKTRTRRTPKKDTVSTTSNKKVSKKDIRVDENVNDKLKLDNTSVMNYFEENGIDSMLSMYNDILKKDLKSLEKEEVKRFKDIEGKINNFKDSYDSLYKTLSNESNIYTDIIENKIKEGLIKDELKEEIFNKKDKYKESLGDYGKETHIFLGESLSSISTLFSLSNIKEEVGVLEDESKDTEKEVINDTLVSGEISDTLDTDLEASNTKDEVSTEINEEINNDSHIQEKDDSIDEISIENNEKENNLDNEMNDETKDNNEILDNEFNNTDNTKELLNHIEDIPNDDIDTGNTLVKDEIIEDIDTTENIDTNLDTGKSPSKETEIDDSLEVSNEIDINEESVDISDTISSDDIEIKKDETEIKDIYVGEEDSIDSNVNKDTNNEIKEDSIDEVNIGDIDTVEDVLDEEKDENGWKDKENMDELTDLMTGIDSNDTGIENNTNEETKKEENSGKKGNDDTIKVDEIQFDFDD